MTRRKSFTALQRARIFKSASGQCHICGGRITVSDRWEVEHIIPLSMGGADDEANTRPAHVKCHRGKTAGDVKNLAKARSREARHLGAKPKGKWASRPFNMERYDNTKYIDRDFDT